MGFFILLNLDKRTQVSQRDHNDIQFGKLSNNDLVQTWKNYFLIPRLYLSWVKAISFKKFQ